MYKYSLSFFVLFAGMSLPADAGVVSLELKVDGLACPFCAYGVEKKLKKIAGVENLEIDLDRGEVRLYTRSGRYLATNTERGAGLVDGVEQAVTEGGFTLREIRARVEGDVLVQKDLWRLQIPETGEILMLRGKTEPLKLLSEKRVSITGILKAEDDAFVLSVERVEEANNLALERYDLKISGMMCSGCADVIKKALEQVGGVRHAHIDLDTGQAFVTALHGKVAPGQLVAAVNELAMEGMPEGTFQASVVKTK